MTDTVLWRWRGVSLTRTRALLLVAVVGLLLLGMALPYATLEHYNTTIEVVRSNASLFGAGTLLGGSIDPEFFPGYRPELRSEMNFAFNVAAVAPDAQQVGTVLGLATCCGLLFDEINKFLWWPLHLSGYLLVLVPLPLFVGEYLLRAAGVGVWVGPAWICSVLAGVLVLVATFRARSRIDSYGGF